MVHRLESGMPVAQRGAGKDFAKGPVSPRSACAATALLSRPISAFVPNWIPPPPHGPVLHFRTSALCTFMGITACEASCQRRQWSGCHRSNMLQR